MTKIKFKYANEKTSFIWQEVECTCADILECIKIYSLDIDSKYVILDIKELTNCKSAVNEDYKSFLLGKQIITKEGYHFREDFCKYCLFKYTGNNTNLILPDNIDGRNYIIDEIAFYFKEKINSVKIPKSVTSIGNYAFEGCFSLTSITIPNSVTNIGCSAFNYCFKLVEIYNLSNLDIEINPYAHDVYGGIGRYAKVIHKNINEPSRIITTKDGYQFIKDYNDIYYLINYIGNDTNLILPNNINGNNYQINDYAFYKCSNITSITIPESVTSIGKWAFCECSSITSITIPQGIKNIGDCAFFGCNKLVKIYNLSSLDIKIGSIDYGYIGFYAKVIHKDINEASRKITTEGGYQFIKDDNDIYYLFNYTGNDTNLILPNNINGSTYLIKDHAFYECSSLTSITIPESVISIGGDAFSYCKSLTNITIPRGVTNIGDRAFVNCSSLTNITIPQGVTYIGEWAFAYCSSLTNITIPRGVTYIGEWAFSGCTNLTIYCEVKSKPSTWSDDWNPSKRPVVWDYKNKN